MSTTKALCVAVAIGVVATSCGDDGRDRAASESPGTPERPRVVEIAMVDIGFEPSDVDVVVGEAVEFVFVNDGAVRHEAVFGDEAVQGDHEVEMQEMGGDMTMSQDDEGEATDHAAEDMAMDHDDEDAVALAVEPGTTEKVVMSFDEPGHTIIGCHESGHWAAGMRVDIDIT
jgi:uncharacterized cupredoxin-like copper-binding protein